MQFSTDLNLVAKVYYIEDILIFNGLIQQRSFSDLVFHMTLIKMIMEIYEKIQTKYFEILYKKNHFGLFFLFVLCVGLDILNV